LFHHFFIADLLPFYCIRFLIIGWNGIILLQKVCKMVESTMLYRTYTCSCAWDLSCRRCIPRRERDVSGVSSTMYLWKNFCLNIWCNLEFWTIWKCIHTMNLNNIKYLAIWLFVNPVQIWIMYEFEFKFKFELEIFNCSLNLYIWLFGSLTLWMLLWYRLASIDRHQRFFDSPWAEVFSYRLYYDSRHQMESIAADIKNGSFFVSYKGYRICWLVPKIGYQSAL
jgi:hypothetical protein